MELSVRIERWPLAGAFTISRGTKTEAVVVVAQLSDGTHRGRGESVPYARYGETPDGVVAAIEVLRPALRRGLTRADLQGAMPAGAPRNALDCAYWDVNAKAAARPVHELAGLVAPEPRITAFTISLAAPAAMAEAAERAAGRPLLKVKLGSGDDDGMRIAAGGGGPRGRPARAQGQARLGRRRRYADSGGAARRAAGGAHRRCQRGLDRRQSCAKSCRLRRRRRDTDRAAVARRQRRGAGAHQAHDPGLRRRERARSRLARGAHRQI